MNPKSKNKPEAAALPKTPRPVRAGQAADAAKSPARAARLFAVNVKPADVSPALPLAPRRPHRSWRMWLLILLLATGALLWVARAQPPETPDPNTGPMPAEDPAQTTAPIEVDDSVDTNPPAPDVVVVVTNSLGQTETQTNSPGRRQRRSFRRRSGSGSRGATGDSGYADDNATNGRPAYSTFSLITQRNIFDPNRRPGMPPRQYTPTVRPPRAEYFALRGTASLGPNTFAVFDGTSSEYHKDLKVADTIAGYKVTRITDDAVKLAAGTNAIELRVGMQMRRQEGGPWLPSAASETFATTANPASAPSTSGGATNVDPPPSGPESDVLQRLMKQREQE